MTAGPEASEVTGEHGDLVRAHGALLRAALAVRFRRRGRLLAPTAPPPVPDGGEGPGSGTHDDAELHRLARLVERAARQSPLRPGCLPRALALHRILERKGIRGSRIRIGVRRREDGRLVAHAWVERGGVPLGQSPKELEAFRPLELTVLGRNGR